MDKTKRYLSVAFVVVLAIVIVVSLIGMILLKKKPVIFCGDLNVAHNEIDLKNPKTNRKNAGFSDEERGNGNTYLR